MSAIQLWTTEFTGDPGPLASGGMLTTNELRRVSIRFNNSEIDLALPFHVPIYELLPAIVDLITAADDELRSALCGRSLNLGRPGAAGLDLAQSLAQCRIDDGALLILTVEPTPRPEYRFDICAIVAESVESVSRPWSRAASQLAFTALLAWFSLVELAFLALPLTGMPAPHHAGLSVATAALAGLGALAIQRSRRTAGAAVVLAVLAAGFAAMAGALAVPGNPGVAHVLLTLSACSAVSVGLARLLHCGTTVLIPLAGITASAAAVTLGAVLQCWSVSAIGPILVAGSLMALVMAPRLAVRTARLSPADPVDDELSERAAAAHAWLTRIVIASTIAVSLGVIVTAVTSPRNPPALALLAAVATALLLHTRRHTEGYRVAALIAGAAVAATTLIVLQSGERPGWAPWLCACLAGLAAGCGLVMTETSWRPSAMADQAMGIIEFGVAAAIVPLTCWAAGLFATVRGLSVP